MLLIQERNENAMDVDSIIIGGGVVGLAIARQMALSGHETILLERHLQTGQEISSRNSEVIHAGIYYPKDSLKAKLCVKGNELLYQYCDSHNVTYQRPGKLIVATDPDQIEPLNDIYQKGQANGVDDLTFLEQDEIAEIEPALKAIKAISSPSTGIISCHELMLAYQADLENAGGIVSLGSPVESIQCISGGFELSIGGEEPSKISCRHLINSAGLGAQHISHSFQDVPSESIPNLYLSKGCYFSLTGKTPFKHLIYPLPSNEGLGVHLTLDLQGCARFGPDTQWVDNIDYIVDPSRSGAFYNAVKQYYPDLTPERLEPAYSGIRPKVSGPGELAADFLIQGQSIHGINNYVALYGIESPGLTASMAIAEYVDKMIS